MTNREFSQTAQGPMTPEGPSVDEIRADLYGGQVAGRFAFRDTEVPMASAVIEGVSVEGDGTVTEEQMAQVRRSAGVRAEDRRALPDEKSFSVHRDTVTGELVRTRADGRPA
ncbi:hypothetical protein OG323_08990 [Streptomyces cyaneofuscatus]|uniref:hypothetical protein n=1 Tax=Streptomyces cyaneofuscatus TaxID=66883 RepID=UPI00386C7984|nr:hypothetical protein OG323_08990 [Streptomyces cyaneofuscatus]